MHTTLSNVFFLWPHIILPWRRVRCIHFSCPVRQTSLVACALTVLAACLVSCNPHHKFKMIRLKHSVLDIKKSKVLLYTRYMTRNTRNIACKKSSMCVQGNSAWLTSHRSTPSRYAIIACLLNFRRRLSSTLIRLITFCFIKKDDWPAATFYSI